MYVGPCCDWCDRPDAVHRGGASSFCVHDEYSTGGCAAVDGADWYPASTGRGAVAEELADYPSLVVAGWPDPVAGGNYGVK